MDKGKQKSNFESKINVLVITASEPHSGWRTYSMGLIKSLEERGVTVFEESVDGPLRFKKNLLLSFYYSFKFYYKHRKHRITKIHCFIEPYAFIALLTSFFMRVPYIVTLHGTYSIKTLSLPVINWFQYLSYGKAEVLVAVSGYTKRRVLELLPNLRIEVINNGISGDISKNSKNLSKNPIILTVGEVKRRKGQHLIIESLGGIKDRLGSFKYYVVGSNNDQEYLTYIKGLVKKHSLEDMVVITGRLSDTQLSKIYDRADVFILTPVSEGLSFEGFGLVYLEANMRGVPVISMYGSGAEDAVKDGYNGLVVRAESIEDVQAKILSILDPSLHRSLSINAIKWANQMSWGNQVYKYIDLYKVK